MKKYLVLGFLLLALVAAPVFAQSTITIEQIIQALVANPALLAQLRSLLFGGNNITPTCGGYTFSRNLTVDSYGNDVVNLHTVLEGEGFGPFGASFGSDSEMVQRAKYGFTEETAAAVVKFQAKYAISPQSGYVGPLTRAKLNALYKSKCVQPINIQAPVITGVSGPSTLNVNETGTWGVRAYDPSGGSLTYSVVWGDEVRILVSQTPGDGMIYLPLQTATFSHSYSNPGSYIPEFYVMNSSGKWAQTSLSVRVGEVSQNGVSVSIQPNSTLALQYDSANHEASLVANFSVAITAGTSDINFFKNGGLSVRARSGQNSHSGQSALTPGTSNAGDTADKFLVSAGMTRSFSVVTTFPVLQMFAGSYVAEINGLYISITGQYINLLGQNNNQTNSVVIVGEKSPYVTWVDWTKDGSFIIKGERLSQVLQAVIENKKGGRLVIDRADFSDLQNTSIGILVSKLNRPAGSYYVYLVSQTGDSNKLGFQISGTTQPSITVLSPNGGENWVAGKSYNVSWSAIGMDKDDAVDIYLCKTMAGCEKVVTGSNISTINLSVNLTGGKDYAVQICKAGSTTICDSSDNYFTITSATQARGVCGSAQGVSSQTQPATNLCSVGNVYNQRIGPNSVNWLWDCAVNNPNDSNDVIGCWAPKTTATTYTIFTNPGYGGLISLSPAKSAYAGDESVKVTAIPNSGYKLASWTGYAANVQPSVTELNLVVTQNMTIGATFTPVASPPVTVPLVVTNTWQQFDACAGGERTSWYTDKGTGKTVNQCVSKSSFRSGATVVANAWLQYGNCGSGTKTSWYTEPGANQTLYQCVANGILANGGEYIANVYVRYDDCLAGDTKTSWFMDTGTNHMIYECLTKATYGGATSQRHQTNQLANIWQAILGLFR